MLKISAEDLESAEILSDRKLFRTACYHAQQSVEKCLKALIVDRDIEIPRTHNILDLNNAAKKLGYTVNVTIQLLPFSLFPATTSFLRI